MKKKGIIGIIQISITYNMSSYIDSKILGNNAHQKIKSIIQVCQIVK